MNPWWRRSLVLLLVALPSGAIRAEEPSEADAPKLTPWVAVRDGLRSENEKSPPFRKRDDRKRHEQVPTAVEAALAWLADHQSEDGGWEAATSSDPGHGLAIYDVGVTGLALTAFVVAGYTGEGEHAFDGAVSKGLTYLKGVQDEEGCFGARVVSPVPQRDASDDLPPIQLPDGTRVGPGRQPGTTGRPTYVYNHATATLAMVEVYGLTRNPAWELAAQRGLDFIALARNPYFAWRYGIKPGDNDTSVTAWMMLPLKTAFFVNRAEVAAGNEAPFRIDTDAFDGIKAWVDKMTDSDGGRTGYTIRGGQSARQDALRDRFPVEKTEAMTAAGMLARVFVGEDPQKSEMFRKGYARLEKLPPVWNENDGSIDMIYWHFATLALHQMGVRRKLGNPKYERNWGEWLRRLETTLLDSQRRDGEVSDAKGSWDPAGAWGTAGGRVYATALNALTLLTPVRFERRGR